MFQRAISRATGRSNRSASTIDLSSEDICTDVGSGDDSTCDEYVVAAIERGKEFSNVDERGRTSVEGLYAAGRIAEKPHQAVVCTGHGAGADATMLKDDRLFYHDWVVPEGYFTDRG